MLAIVAAHANNLGRTHRNQQSGLGERDVTHAFCRQILHISADLLRRLEQKPGYFFSSRNGLNQSVVFGTSVFKAAEFQR